MKALHLPVSENKNFEVDLCSYVLTCDTWGGTFWTPGALYKKNVIWSTIRCYMPNIKALDLPVSKRKIFEDGLLCS